MELTATRLSLADLGRLPPRTQPLISVPRPGIVHIGLGAFHRAHQAVFTESAMAAGGGDWGIIAVAPRSRDVVDAINTQDGLFSVTSLSDGASRTRVVGSVVAARHLPTEAARIIELLTDPEIRVVTLTVTEKAYLLDAGGRLRDYADLRADLDTDAPPRTIPGLLARALRLRAAAGGAPLAVVSCDNLPGNGQRLRAVVSQALDTELGDWVSFPDTVVDRIVPASTPATFARARTALGVADLAAVDAEPFRQWVLEDRFPGGRPDWGAAGAVFSTDVEGFERLKLRMLNGVHSTVAYLGALAGCVTVADAIRLPGMRSFLRDMMRCDIEPTLRPPPDVQVAAYADSVLDRFGNSAIAHRTLQVAADGSQKLPQRILATLAERRAVGAEPVGLATGLAAWIRFAGGRSDDGGALDLDDPLAPVIRAALRDAGGEPRARVGAIFRIGEFAPPALADDEVLVSLVADRLAAIDRDGAATTVAREGR